MPSRVLLLSLLTLPAVAAWAPCLSVGCRRTPAKPAGVARAVTHARHARVALLVTEDDVEAAVEKAEKLWAQALDARQRSDKLSGEAEAIAEEVARTHSPRWPFTDRLAIPARR